MLRLSAPDGLRKLVKTGFSLSDLTTWRVGGRAKTLVAPLCEESLVLSVKWLSSEADDFYVLGGGSNTLVADGEIDTPVLLTTGMSKVEICRSGSDIFVKCGAGACLREIFMLAVREGWSGLEFAAGMPGTIGGALVGNAGTPLGDISSIVESVRVVRSGGVVENLKGNDIEWGYRKSGLMDGDAGVISMAVLKLRESAKDIVASNVMAAVKNRRSQPIGAKTAGCVFKNPPGDSAGRLLDVSGCKGLLVGGARVSPLHANFIENHAMSSAEDILNLAMTCRQKVRDMFGINLQFEIKAVGFHDALIKR